MNEERLLKIILAPLISEKATRLADKNHQILFKVSPDATKAEIKAAVEKLFDVKVKNVQVSNVKGKRKIFKQILGVRKNWKKAYVSLQEGYDINFVGAE